MPLHRGSATCFPGQLLKKMLFWGTNLLHDAFLVIWSGSLIQTSCTNPGGVWLTVKWGKKRGRLQDKKKDKCVSVSRSFAGSLYFECSVSAVLPTDWSCNTQGRCSFLQCRNQTFHQKMKFKDGGLRQTWQLLFCVSFLLWDSKNDRSMA